MPGENANVEEEQIWAAAFICETAFICGKDSHTSYIFFFFPTSAFGLMTIILNCLFLKQESFYLCSISPGFFL